MAGASFPQHVLHQEVWEGEAPCTQRGHLSRVDSPMSTQGGIFSGRPFLVLGYRRRHSRRVPCVVPGGGIYRIVWDLASSTAVSVAPVNTHLCQQPRFSPPLDVSHLHWWGVGAQLLRCIKVPEDHGALGFSDLLQSDQRAEAEFRSAFWPEGCLTMAVCGGLFFASQSSEAMSHHTMWSAPFPLKRFVFSPEGEQVVDCYKEK